MSFIFDLDGTLIDTPRGISESVRAALGSDAVPTDEQIAPLIGKPLSLMFTALVGPEADIEALVARFRQDFAQRVVPQAAQLVFPGIPQVLEALREQGPLAVATSKITTSAREVLDSAGLLQHFDLVAGADAVTRAKPAPDLALHAAEQLGVLPKDCIVIGDSVHDIGMGVAAGMRTIGVNWGVNTAAELFAAGAPIVIHEVPSLADVLQASTVREKQVEHHG